VLLVLGAGLWLWPHSKPERASAAPAIITAKGRVTVEVLNGTQRQGAARTATRMLRRSGLDVVFLGNADSTASLTRVLARRGDSVQAKYVATALGAGAVRVEIDTFRRVDVSVILGEDFRPRLEVHP
jgi:uncharacterized lipoprotein NlpE involved in copper resistance